MVGERLRVGVLALQGAFKQHLACLKQLNCQTVLVKQPEQLVGLDGLIIPGGESTTIGKLLVEYDFIRSIQQQVEEGMGVFGTCAGMILLANKIVGQSEQPGLGLIEITVARNAFGRQVDSFETVLTIKGLDDRPFPAIFIRAPEIIAAGTNVETLAEFAGRKVLARQKRVLVSAFHPELTDDLRLHRYFLSLLDQGK